MTNDVDISRERLERLFELGSADYIHMAMLDRIEKLERALDIYERERARFRHAKPEMTGAYYLAGGYGTVDSNMLPEYVRIVPAYGCAWEQVYVKTDRTISYEGS